jgi:hypothetical protein
MGGGVTDIVMGTGRFCYEVPGLKGSCSDGSVSNCQLHHLNAVFENNRGHYPTYVYQHCQDAQRVKEWCYGLIAAFLWDLVLQKAQ